MKVSFIYIVEPPEYQILACTLLASIRTQFPDTVRAIGYCPAHRIDELHPGVLRAHEIMGAEIRPMETRHLWETPYPHGNKIAACLQPRQGDFAVFVDSDVLFLRPNDPANLCRAGQVSCTPAASLIWAGDEIWGPIYDAFGLPVPEERIHLMRRSAEPRIPYYSSGLVGFPEGSFPQVWYETSRVIDALDDIPHRRPYLDQLSLPVAIARAGLAWHRLPEEQHYILGGRIRGEPLPDDREIFAIHYRHTGILKELGLHGLARGNVQRLTGEKYVRRLAPGAKAPLQQDG